MGAKSHLDFGDSSPENSLMHTAVAVKPDFSGWATKFGLKCSDGRTILPGAFSHQNEQRVPMVWQHGHNLPENVLGHTVLEVRDEGVYTYGFFNETAQAKNAKTLVQHGDISSLSIFANQLVEKARHVSHGMIREVSLVLAGANPGALIDNIEVMHGDGSLDTVIDEAVIYTGLSLEHEDGPATADPDVEEDEDKDTQDKPDKKDTEVDHNDGAEDDTTVQGVYDSMTSQQKEVVHYMVGAALESTTASSENGSSDEEVINHEDKEQDTMKRNVFEQNKSSENGNGGEVRHVLSHDAMRAIAADAVRVGSLKEAVEDYAFKHGIDDIDTLFPDARNVTDRPEFDTRRTEWVAEVLGKIRKSPFSRIKSVIADITHAEARARGYVKGTLKKEEYFGLTKRVTTPATVYKKQSLDRDDIVDITDFDVVMWLKGEMRIMLEEELARAVLIGDGRDVGDDDKIKDPQGVTEGAGIRSILHDHDLYSATVNIDLNGDLQSTELVDKILGSMRFYKGSGMPTFYTTLPTVTQMLLSRDNDGRRYYRTMSELASELGCDTIVPVEVMEDEDGLLGIIVNLKDYTLGADKGGEVSFFDDFDIDYNKYKYLTETRVSGALTKIRSAIVVHEAAGDANEVTPAAPDFDGSEISITDQTGVTYKRGDTNATVTSASSLELAQGDSLTIYAIPSAGTYFFPNNVEDSWQFTGE